jgi:hypothetical protein
MIRTVHDSRIVNKEGKDKNPTWKFGPHCAVQSNKFMKGVDSTDHCLSYYSVLRKTVN